MTAVRVDEISARARTRQFRPGRVALTAFAAVAAGLGWLTGRFFLTAGWIAGRTWLILAFFIESVIYGFRAGAQLPPAPARAPDKTAGE